VLFSVLAIASGSAAAQILPPAVEQPTEILQPPAGYPPTTAQSAVGTYFATPAWAQKLAPNARFVILTSFSSDAVLDRETGLVWARQNLFDLNSPGMRWRVADLKCRNLVIAGRGGWRLPGAAELQTLVDFSVASVAKLPAGHPFFLTDPIQLTWYWTMDLYEEDAYAVSVQQGATGTFRRQGAQLFEAGGALCVRGGE
jgi:hypothetical protein